MPVMPRPSEEAKQAFRALVPEAGAVALKPMFGNLAAFVNGNMFAGLFGDDLFVRVGAADRETLLAKGGRDFEPMAGRPMTGYVVLPAGWQTKSKEPAIWIATALDAASKLPAKTPRSKAGSKAKAATSRTR